MTVRFSSLSPASLFRKILLSAAFFLLLTLRLCAAAPAALPQQTLAGFLQKEGILKGPFRAEPNDIGFAIDTAAPKAICCDALFMEILRAHLTPRQIAEGATHDAHHTAFAADAASVLYKPFEAGNLIFVLVENAAPKGRSASLVVVKKEDGVFSVVEQSPLCRARCSADDFRK